jgi:hypothetical protein
MRKDVELIVDYAARTLPLVTAVLPDEYFYGSLTQCVIDAVWSIGVRYEGVRRVVGRYSEHAGLPLIRSDRSRLPAKDEQQSLRTFCEMAQDFGADRMATLVFRNRQRTSSRSGILKAEAVYRFASCLRANGVEYFQDVAAAMKDQAVERAIRTIPGQGSGLSLRYFLMLAGSDEFIKSDRMINRFVESILHRPVSSTEADALLRESALRLRQRYPHMTPRLLDHEAWRHQRDRKN